MTTAQPGFDPVTLFVFGYVIEQAAANMHADDESEDYRKGFLEAGRLASAYGSLLGRGLTMEQISALSIQELKRREAEKVQQMKDIVGDD